ncbi:hypothetical protein CHARACLAT_022510 [Characodon lateralis]|uniref:Uncharacterized protein n=1 Tax=Characodon lateralis TaxID=208331 RepID=A0ABU7D9V3_9TELE|nr:hypothetical protein [Characodon lateralis]
MSLRSSPVSSLRLSAHLPVHPPTLHAFWQLCCSYDHRKPTGNDSTSSASPSSPRSSPSRPLMKSKSTNRFL